MKAWITILLTFVIATSWGQNKQPKELGIGFAVAADPYQFEDLSHPSEIYLDQALTKKRASEKVFPFFYKPDYGLYHFICLEKTKSYYKVLINDTEIAFIPNNADFYFKSWDAILLQATVERLTSDNLIQRDWADDNKTIQNNCEFDRLAVEDTIEKNGEYWLSISFSPTCEDYPDQNSHLERGWIKWRAGERLLINILLLC